MMRAEIAEKADFEQIRYAQCWEDADVLLEALDVKTDGSYLSIASAGDNTLALVGAGAGATAPSGSVERPAAPSAATNSS